MKRIAAAVAAVGFALVLSATSASAHSVDLATGVGFVGKGEVQSVLGWNNKALQDGAASAIFTIRSVSEASTTWTCDRDGGPQTQERANTTTTTTSGVASSVARERNQITGFNLTGLTDTTTVETDEDGPAVGSCPTGWTAIDLVEGEPVLISGGLYVNGVLLP